MNNDQEKKVLCHGHIVGSSASAHFDPLPGLLLIQPFSCPFLAVVLVVVGGRCIWGAVLVEPNAIPGRGPDRLLFGSSSSPFYFMIASSPPRP